MVGGGYTGMWAAWELLERGATVALLEAGVCGHGPSGRNGGFCESLWLSAGALRDRFGDAPARALLEASTDTVGRIGAWCRDEGVDAWFDQSGYMCVSTAPAFDHIGAPAVAAAAALGAPDRVVAPDVAFARALDRNRDRTKYNPGSPTLAVEVVSPNDRESKVARKVLEYLDAGAERVWVVRPESRTVTVHRPNGDSHTYRMGDTLTSEDAALPEGFALTLEAIFATE